jgi:uncharacterized protein YjbI with pentapeptide repeats/class 3 adenylate cyclase
MGEEPRSSQPSSEGWRLRQGVSAWNAWRHSGAEGAARPELGGEDLAGLDLCGALLQGAVLRGAQLMDAQLASADLERADLTGACLSGADLCGANLRGALLRDADLSMATLIGARLEGAVLTGACLWETRRADWSIARVECGYAFWDERGTEEHSYAPGEFARAYGAPAPRVLAREERREVELALLPLLIERCEARAPGARLRIRRVESQDATPLLELCAEPAPGDDALALREELETVRAELERVEAEHARFVEKVVPLLDALGQPYRVPMTVLFLDLAGFARMPAALQREAVEIARLHAVGLTRRFRPKYSNTWGDAIVAAFDDPNAGLEFACRLLQYLGIDAIGARIGMSFGELELHPDRVRERIDIKGPAMSEGGRLEPMAEVGEVLISRALHEHPAIRHERFRFLPFRRALKKSVAELQAGELIECYGVELRRD